MSVPAVLLRISTGEIIKHDLLPADPTGAVPGLDPDLKWLIKHEPFPSPTVDTRYYTVARVEEVMVTQHPTYPLYDQYSITYTTPKRAIEEINDHAYNAERDALNRVFTQRDQIKLLALGLGVLFRSVDGLQLSAKETTIKTNVMSLALKLWNNDANLKAKLASIAAGEEPDIDQGWEL
jgi:hypothetical protein